MLWPLEDQNSLDALMQPEPAAARTELKLNFGTSCIACGDSDHTSDACTTFSDLNGECAANTRPIVDFPIS